ncbi:MAG: mitochondrial fission ELM1 family protein [Pseudomonadota bacterium]
MNEDRNSPLSSAHDGSASQHRSILVLTDGRAGNRALALGLAEALERLAVAPRFGPVLERLVAPQALAAQLPAAVWHALGRLPGWPALGLQDGAATLAPPQADIGLLIGAGRRAAPVVAWLARRYALASIQLLNPQMDPAAFTLVAAPDHDGLTAPNALATLGSPGRITGAGIAKARDALPKGIRLAINALPRPRLAVLLGGPSASAGWSRADANAFVRACSALAEAGHGLIVTPSRRTDPAVPAALQAQIPADRLWLWDGAQAGGNPYPGMLGLADAVLVTADSVNMASEAAASGLPLHVFPIARLGPKLQRFHAALEAHGAARPFSGRIESWDYAPLAEADRLAGIVASRLSETQAPPTP